MTTFRNSIRDVTKFYYRCQKYHPMKSWKVCTNLGYVSLINSTSYWKCTTWKFIKRYRRPIIRSWKPWWKGEKVRNFVYETLMPGMRKLNLEPKEIFAIGVEGGKGICYQWSEKGQWSKGDRCSFRHVTQDRAQKPEHTAATPSEPTVSRGRSVSRERSIRGKGNNGSIRQPCRIKQERVVRRETRVCFFIAKLMKTKALSLSRKAYHNWVVYHRTRMHSFFKEQKSFGETRCRKSWTQFEKFDSLSPRYVKRVSGKK